MAQSPVELGLQLERLLRGSENELVEFKQASTTFDLNKLGRYVSALSNEANLHGADAGWLIFGVDDDRNVTGTSFRSNPGGLEKLKQEIAENLFGSHGIQEIHEIVRPDGRVILFEIAPAPAGIPVAWKGQYCARSGESLGDLSQSKIDQIRRQIAGDWTAEIVSSASIADLDPIAIAAAREAFIVQHPSIPASEIEVWSEVQLLEHADLAVSGKLTRAAVLLLGRAQSAMLLGATMPEVTWILDGEDRVYEHFGLPFFDVADRLYDRIRNYQVRLLQPGALVQTEVSKYDRQSILEALHNCIAHADYREGARFIVTERADELVFENSGDFYDGSPREYIVDGRTPRKYRNPQLVRAMTRLNMIDHTGYGIRQIGQSQVKRFLPLPDYDTNHERVKLTIYGAAIDVKYTELLMERTDLPLIDVFALDRVQKGLPIPQDAIDRLRKAKLIEGRKPRLHISAAVASATGAQADYMRHRELEDEHYLALLYEYIEKFGPVKRADLDAFIWDKLHSSLSDVQKGYKVKNLLQKLKNQERVEVVGAKRGAQWQVTK